MIIINNYITPSLVKQWGIKSVDDFELVQNASKTIYRQHVTLPTAFSTTWEWAACTTYINSAMIYNTSSWTGNTSELTILSEYKESGYSIMWIAIGH